MKRRVLVTMLCSAISVSAIACGTENTTEQLEEIATERLSITEETTEQIEETATETDNMTETVENNSKVYETDSIEDTMAVIHSYGTNVIDNYSVLKYQFYTDTIEDAGAYYTVKCDIYRSVSVDDSLSIGDTIEIVTDETKNETHELLYEAEHYLIDIDTGMKYYYKPYHVGNEIRLFEYERTYNENIDLAQFFSENELLCKIYTGVIKLSKNAEVVDELEDINGPITMENIAKSDGWFNMVAFSDEGEGDEAVWILDVGVIYNSNKAK